MSYLTLLVAGCGTDDSAPADDESSGGVEASAPTRAAKEVAADCSFGSDSKTPPTSNEVRAAFVPGIDGPRHEPVRLLVEGTLVEPGSWVHAAIDNGGPDGVLYGLIGTSLREDETNTLVYPSTNDLQPAIGFLAQPGDVGQCTAVRVPREAEPGRYTITVRVDPAGDGRANVVGIPATIVVGGRE